jgi:hypothetical protein
LEKSFQEGIFKKDLERLESEKKKDLERLESEKKTQAEIAHKDIERLTEKLSTANANLFRNEGLLSSRGVFEKLMGDISVEEGLTGRVVVKTVCNRVIKRSKQRSKYIIQYMYVVCISIVL